MILSPRCGQLSILALLFLPLLITFGSLLGNHTISFCALRGGDPTRSVSALPVLDPSAGSHQDEPWTYLIGESWAKGEIPLINQANGLGAPLLASLQSGALYPGNLLLTILPRSSAQFFDVFSIAHVALLAWGLYALARRFTSEPWLAALVAGSLAASLATIYHINMVHLRAFAWAPWIAVGLIDLVQRPGRNLGAVAIFALATCCCFSAGNPQEAVLDFSAAAVVAGATIVRDGSWRRLWALAAALGFGLLIGSTTMLPYLSGLNDGDLWSVADPNRSQLTIRPTMLLDMIVPRGTGYAGGMWHFGTGFFELQFAWPVTWLLGLIGLIYAARIPRTVWPIALLLSVIGLFVCKLAGLGPWAWIAQIPILNGIRFTKYTFWTILVLAPVVVTGLDALQARCRQEPAVTIRLGLAIVAVFALAFLGYLTDENWRPVFDGGGVRIAAAMALVSLCGALALPWILGHRHRLLLLIAWVLTMAYALRPAGFHLELPYDQMRSHQPPAALTAANLTDNNWDLGIHRTAPAFFVSDPSTLSTLNPGDALTMPSGQSRAIFRVSGDQVWLDGTDLLNPVTDGFPHPITMSPAVALRQRDLQNNLSAPWPRVVDASYTPNTNLILGYSSPWVFDPVMNRRYRDLVTREFQTFNPGFDTHPASAYPLSERHANVLRMLGVGTVIGHVMAPTPYYRSASPTTHRAVEGLLPEAMVIPETAVAGLTGLFLQGRYGEFVDAALVAGQPCSIERPGPNAVTVVTPPGSDPRRVLLNRVFMSGWTTPTGPAQPLADFWLTTPAEPGGGAVTFRYWPPGLTLGLLLAAAGALGLAVLVVVDRRLVMERSCPG